MQRLIYLMELGLYGFELSGFVRKRGSMHLHACVCLLKQVHLPDMVSVSVLFGIILSKMGLYGVSVSTIGPWDILLPWPGIAGTWGWVVYSFTPGFCLSEFSGDGSVHFLCLF